MEILYLLDQFPSDSETFIAREMEGLADLGMKIHVCAYAQSRTIGEGKCSGELYYSRDGFFHRIVDQWFTLLKRPAIFMEAWWKVATAIFISPGKGIRRAKELIRAFGFYRQVHALRQVHVHSQFASGPAGVGQVLARLLKSKFSFSAHARDLYIEAEELAVRIRQATFVCTCTAANHDYLSRVAEDNTPIHHVYHGIDAGKWAFREEAPRWEGEIQILAVGRLVEKKGLKYLLAGLGELKNSKHSFFCTIVGEGPERNSLEKQIVALGLQSMVRMLGAVSPQEVQACFEAADVLVQPSVIARDGDKDGLPNVLLEACALGVPVISTRVSSIPELIRDEENGLLLPHEDGTAIAEALTRLAEGPELREMLRLNARKEIEARFSLRGNMAKLLSVYQQYLSP